MKFYYAIPRTELCKKLRSLSLNFHNRATNCQTMLVKLAALIAESENVSFTVS